MNAVDLKRYPQMAALPPSARLGFPIQGDHGLAGFDRALRMRAAAVQSAIDLHHGYERRPVTD